MPDWTDVVSVCVGVAGFTFGLTERYRGKRGLRIDKINQVVEERETRVLFSESVPDVALRPLAASAKEWRKLCGEARAVTSQGSPARHALKICLDAAARFENEVEKMLGAIGSADPYVFVSGTDRDHLDELKLALRRDTDVAVERLKMTRRWWQL